MNTRSAEFLAVLVTVAGIGACADKPVEHSLELRDNSGSIVATLTIALPPSLPGPGQHFEGVWQLRAHTPAFAIGSVEPGHYRGTHLEQKLHLDLNPRWADNNVILESRVGSAPLEGEWCLATIAGCHPQGSFRPSR